MAPTSLDQMSIVRQGVRVPMLGDYDPAKHGVSVTILQDFLECREKVKFRVNRVQQTGSALPLTFGGTGHEVLKLAHDEIRTGKLKKVPSRKKVERWIAEAEVIWKRQNPMASAKSLQTLELSLGFLEAVMPVYFDYHKATLFNVEWIAVEDWFNVEYPIEVDGRTIMIPINGKLDGLYRKNNFNYVFESKFKSMFDTGRLIDLLELDLQVLVYMYCISVYYDIKVRGCTYNIIRRPGLRQGTSKKNPEPFAKYIKRCVKDVQTRPDFYFHRVPMTYTQAQINNVETMLDGLLRDFYLWSTGAIGDYKTPAACEMKYGACSFLPICARGDWSAHVIKEKRK